MTNPKADTKKERILVLGAAESGTGAALLAKQKGFPVVVSDKGTIQERYKNVLCHAEIDFEEGAHSPSVVDAAELVIKSPGIPDDAPLIMQFRERGIKVISEIEFAARFTNAGMVCITGSNGKTTTTTLTHHMLTKGGVDAAIGGNVGKSLALELTVRDHPWFVLEISSFQLDGMFDFKADIAVLTNITPDHMDRYHNDFNAYANSKFRIINNHTAEDAFVYCADDPVILRGMQERNIVSRCFPFSLKSEPVGEGAFQHKNEIIIRIHKKELKMSIEAIALQGRHNIYNSMAAAIVGQLFNLRKDIIRESLMDFQELNIVLNRWLKFMV